MSEISTFEFLELITGYLTYIRDCECRYMLLSCCILTCTFLKNYEDIYEIVIISYYCDIYGSIVKICYKHFKHALVLVRHKAETCVIAYFMSE